MADRPLTTDRRSILAAAPLAAVALALPAAAMASPLPRHPEWLEQRRVAFLYANERGISEKECDRRVDALQKLEDRILETPARNAEEMRAKCQLAATLAAESMTLGAEQYAALLAEAASWLARSNA